jgi:hypothetical protein
MFSSLQCPEWLWVRPRSLISCCSRLLDRRRNCRGTKLVKLRSRQRKTLVSIGLVLSSNINDILTKVMKYSISDRDFLEFLRERKRNKTDHVRVT